MSSRRVQVLDTTLRDGEQSPGIAFAPAQKLAIARQLDRLGVDVIEAGFPVTSPGDLEGVRLVAGRVRRPVIAAMARTRRLDIDAAAGALQGARRSRLHLVLATSPIHLTRKLRLSEDEVVEQAAWAVGYGRTRFDEVQFCCEDASRSEPAFVARVCRAVLAAGADAVNLPDTVGIAVPDEYEAFVREVRRLCPPLDRALVAVHCHDDLGLATANTLAGVTAGAGQVECTINGLGERAGNAALEEVVAGLERLGVEHAIDGAQLVATSRLVAREAGYAVQRWKAVVGENVAAATLS